MHAPQRASAAAGSAAARHARGHSRARGGSETRTAPVTAIFAGGGGQQRQPLAATERLLGDSYWSGQALSGRDVMRVEGTWLAIYERQRRSRKAAGGARLHKWSAFVHSVQHKEGARSLPARRVFGP